MPVTNSERGYQCKKNKILEIDSPFGSAGAELITQVIYCSYPGDKSYLVASAKTETTDTRTRGFTNRIIVAEFNVLFNSSTTDDNPSSSSPNDVKISILNQYPLRSSNYENDTNMADQNRPFSKYQISKLVPLRKDKCFLAMITMFAIGKEMLKVEIESGNVIWRKPIGSDLVVEDTRGIIFHYYGFERCYLELFDSHTGNLLNKIKLHSANPIGYGIGLDVNGNLLIGGYKKIDREIRVLDKRGKLVKKLKCASSIFTSLIDPYKKVTYISSSDNYLARVTHNYDFDMPFNNVTTSIRGCFFVENCKYLVVCDANKLLVYD